MVYIQQRKISQLFIGGSMLQRTPGKKCRWCGDPHPKHWPYQCYRNPNRKTTINPIGKQTKQWLVTRATWIRKNPPNHQGYWICYLQIHPNCPKFLTDNTLTLDHVVARTRDQSKRFEQGNLRPACAPCNEMKGSRKLDDVK